MIKKLFLFLFPILFIPFIHVKASTQVYTENVYAELSYLTYKVGSTETGLNYNQTITTGSNATEYYFNTYANLDITNLESGSLVPNFSYVRLSFCSTGGMSNGYGGDSYTTDVRFNVYNNVSCITYNGSQGYLIQATFKVATRTISGNANRLDISSSIGTFVNSNSSFSLIGVDFASTPFTRLNETDSINNNLINIYKLLDNSSKVCTKIDKSSVEIDNMFLNSNGTTGSSSAYIITKYFKINDDDFLERVVNLSTSNNAYFCFYNTNKELINCETNLNQPVGNITIPTNSSYVRFSIVKSLNEPQFNLCRNANQAINDQQEENNKIQQERNDFLNDDDTSESSSTGSSFFNSFNTSDHGLTGIITAPLNLITSITSKSCSPLVVPLPFVNENLSLPCMSSIYSQYFGSFYDIYKVITFGIVAYWICVRIFAMVKDFKNPEHDEIEVVDL